MLAVSAAPEGATPYSTGGAIRFARSELNTLQTTAPGPGSATINPSIRHSGLQLKLGWVPELTATATEEEQAARSGPCDEQATPETAMKQKPASLVP